MVIVGATGQLGTAITIQLAAMGCDLGICGIDGPELEQLAHRLENDRQIVVAHSWADVTQSETLDAFLASYASSQRVDWIVINAGVGSARASGQYIESPEAINSLVAVNLLGCINAIRSAVTTLERTNGGRIIVVSSLASFAGSPENPAYAATKAAIRIACLSMQPALARRNIAFTLAHPGFLAERTQDGGANWRPFAMSPEAAAEKIIKAALRKKFPVKKPF